ncbi:MAG: hypothetical protein SFV18_10955 [Bryobacteraceae bacterium]|nr:hypothetical protein [Bryobacteraceae bacterium]
MTALAPVLTMLALLAQQPVAPTPEVVGAARGEDWLGYNIRQSFELGVRTMTVDGDRDKYRSDVNYRNGLRLLSSKLDMQSRNGDGKLFDRLSLSTLGLGNDPYQFASFTVEKNSIYRYDLVWRENAYFNPAAAIADGRHRLDTTRRLQDHTLTLFPGRNVQVFGGYSRNSQSGPGLTTYNLFDQHRGDVATLLADVRRQQNEYRLGGEAKFAGFKLIAVRNWEFFRDDTRDFADTATPGEDPTDGTTLTRLSRAQPNHGSSPGWRANLFTERAKRFAVNARLTWVAGKRNFMFDETAIGTDRFGNGRNRQTIVVGDARRPVLAANATVSVFPTESLTITNHTSFTQTRIEGESRFAEFNNSLAGINFTSFEFLGIRLISNSTDAQLQLGSKASVHGGYHFSERRIRSIQDEIFTEQTNRLNAGALGFRLRPFAGFSIHVDGELGRANNPFYPTSEKNYHGLSSRVQYKRRALTLGAQAKSNYNFNSVSLFAHSARARSYSVDGSWQARDWLGFDANYSKQHLDTLTGIAFFYQGILSENERSWYVSNVHTFFGGVRASIRKRVDLYASHSYVKDAGGPSRPNVLSYFQTFQSLPFVFQAPMFRISIPVTRDIRWNAGYQFYKYGGPVADGYRAHTAYVSLLWSF